MLKSKNLLCVFALAVVVLSGCGSSKEALLVSDIDNAVEAVAEVLGKTPEFYEINATPTLVNLFAADGKGNAINFVFEEIRFSISSTSYPLSAPTGTQLMDAPHCSA